MKIDRQSLLLGILIGLIIGGSIGLFYMNFYGDEVVSICLENYDKLCSNRDLCILNNFG